ncbi:hypothetical protein GOP47_0005642 [Adiantum capillus-veneris]|uniref:Pentatricopeptide repeat-containing protein n=1 Tax=Adiantum capillus-veneris TaxID=13818 RepID=A0A9D4V6N6_ADICA|nr:hypothetical protein GOP47_0005642 [Adiantum capillus-veneris]
MNASLRNVRPVIPSIQGSSTQCRWAVQGTGLSSSTKSLWQEFFRDPSKWWDNRHHKRTPRQPDFQHKLTKEPLWTDSSDNPSWVEEKLIMCGFAKEQRCIESVSSLSNANISPSLIWACCKTKDLSTGSRIHDELQRRGFAEKNFSDALITMYAKCGVLKKAQALLDIHNSSSIIPWNALIVGYARGGQGQNALDCFNKMQYKDIPPDEFTYACILKACAVIGNIDKGEKIHNEISRQGLLEHNIVLGNTLVDMYAKCGALCQARNALKELPCRNIISWSALIAGYSQKGHGQQALECYEQMQHEGISPDAVTYVCILKACVVIQAINKGKEIHEEILRQGLLEHEIVLGGALVDMYAQCGSLPQAHRVLEELPFRNSVCWNALLAGYAQKGQGQQALDCFEQMQHESIRPDAVTYVCILKACAAIEAIDKGKQVHDQILRQGLLQHDIVLGCALVDMYVQCGALCQAQSVLKKLPSRNVVCWNALIMGYARNEQGQQALECLEQMQHEGISADKVTFLGILKACAVIEAIEKGKQIHDEVSRQGLLEHDILLGGALIDMYVQCGALELARSVLEELRFRNIVCWNTLISGYARNGQDKQAMECLEQMQREGILPDMVTFVCLLNLCNHLGLIEKGEELFDTMEAMYGLKPDIECFTCMVDLYGHGGHLGKAVKVIRGMPCSANPAIWHCLLRTCRKWVDVNVGIWAFEQAIELDKCDGAAYALMVKIYAAAGMLEKAKEVEAWRIKNKAWKQLGCSLWTTINNKVLIFVL